MTTWVINGELAYKEQVVASADVVATLRLIVTDSSGTQILNQRFPQESKLPQFSLTSADTYTVTVQAENASGSVLGVADETTIVVPLPGSTTLRLPVLKVLGAQVN